MLIAIGVATGKTSTQHNVLFVVLGWAISGHQQRLPDTSTHRRRSTGIPRINPETRDLSHHDFDPRHSLEVVQAHRPTSVGTLGPSRWVLVAKFGSRFLNGWYSSTTRSLVQSSVPYANSCWSLPALGPLPSRWLRRSYSFKRRTASGRTSAIRSKSPST